MKKILLFVVILVAIAAVFMITKNTTNAPSDDTTEVTDERLPTDRNMPPPTETTPIHGITETGGDTIEKEIMVSYGPNGFEPKEVTTTLGSKVTWVNESENFMWVAASKHPVHADYPEKTDKDCLGSAFDQCISVGTGESYSFKFMQKGSWNYHNHVAPNNWGTVVVQ